MLSLLIYLIYGSVHLFTYFLCILFILVKYKLYKIYHLNHIYVYSSVAISNSITLGNRKVFLNHFLKQYPK